MARAQLQAASEALRRAAEASSGDLEEAIYEQSNQLAGLAVREEAPDHGRLARHTQSLQELAEEADGETREAIEEAVEGVRSFREGVEGV
jgi:hypothetical protein